MRLPLLAGIASLVVASLAAPGVGAQAPDARADVERVLQTLGFTSQDLATLQSGGVITRADSGTSGEMVTQAAVKIRVPHDSVVNYYGQMIAYVDGQVTLGFNRFSTPAVVDDVAKLSFDRDEIETLKRCRVGRCDIRLGGAGLSALQAAVDWNAPDYQEKANAFLRKSAVDYVNAYRTRGDEALVTFDDRSKPVSLKTEWSALLANSTQFHALMPELARYLSTYPKQPLAGARDVIYWIRENYGIKPISKTVTSIVHGVIYTPPSQTDRTIVAQKYIYASHYYDASLALAAIVSGTENGAPVSYILYTNRSRGDLLRGGGFGSLTRNTARSQARKAAEDTLTTIQQVLEKSGRGF